MTLFPLTIALLIGAFLLIFLAFRAIRSVSAWRYRRSGEIAAINTLAAMCLIAKASGETSPAEVEMIAAVILEKTGRHFSIQQVAQMIEQTEDQLAPKDYASFGKGLSAEAREKLIEAALLVAVASGEIREAEHSRIVNLAQGLNISAASFRKTLHTVASEVAGLSPSTSANPA